jgi:hypothetical protein
MIVGAGGAGQVGVLLPASPAHLPSYGIFELNAKIQPTVSAC